MSNTSLLEEIVAEALDRQDPAERDRYVDGACASDAELRARVQSMLDAIPVLGKLLERQAGRQTRDSSRNEFLKETVDSSHTILEGPGTIIGPYKLLQRIGEGGMGTVFMAEQIEPIRRKVALKIIKPGLDTRQVVARFEAERQALALMDHPNIAKVLDAGLTPGGQPFFVMELVDGLPLNKFCDDAKLTPRDRLELFVPICQAVQHAHQKGIVHRDLKPANILITMIDGRSVPKVIDFGVAKAIGGKLTDDSLATQFGAVVGTLEYMSPEQAGFSGIDVDTRADIYSLGVILYELLTGLRPIDAKRLRHAALTEMIRIIQEEEPSKPSTRLSIDASLPSIAALRQTEPHRLMSMLRGELDWVVMKCLEKHRERRYETANGLARDIQRYLADEPVEARPRSARYRLQKFLRRNKGPVIAASLLFVAMLAGITGTTFGLVCAKKSAKAERKAKLDAQDKEKLAVKAGDKERMARLEEERQRKFAEAINRFVQDDFLALTSVEGQDRFGGEGKDVLNKDTTLLQLLDRAADKLRTRKDLDPRIEAELCWIVGINYRGAGEPKKAIEFLERAVQLRSQALGRDHADTLNAMNSLAVGYSADGKLELALQLHEKTLRDRKTKLGPEHPDTLTSMNNLALAYLAAGKLNIALPLFEQTLKLMKTTLGPEHAVTLRSMNNLAGAYKDAGKLEMALTLLRETLRLQTLNLGVEHRDTLRTMNGLAEAYHAAGKLELALPILEKTLDLRRATLGSNHPETLGSMNNLAGAYKDAGKLDLAPPLFEENLNLVKAKLGFDHPDTLTSMNNLAMAYQGAGKLDIALPLFEETLKLRKAKLGPEHPDTILSMSCLASTYQAAGKLDLALPMFKETLELMKAKLGTDHVHTLLTMNNLALAYYAAGKPELALPLLEKTLELRNATLGPDHPETLGSIKNLAWAYKEAGKLDLATPLFEETLKLVKAKLGSDHPESLTSMNNLALAYLAAGKLNLALPLFEETLKLRKAKLDPEHLDTILSMSCLASTYQAAGKLDLALPMFEEALKRMQAKLGRSS